MQLFTSDLIRGNIANSFVLMKSCLVSYQQYKPSAFVLKLDLLVRSYRGFFSTITTISYHMQPYVSPEMKRIKQ